MRGDIIQFKSINEIQNYYQKALSSGKQSVLKDIKDKNGKSLDEVTDALLIEAGEYLRKCIQKYLSEYYDFFHTPKYYTRTYGLKNALTVETQVHNDGGNKYIGLYFQEDKSVGQSVVNGGRNYWKPALINDGWKDKSYSTPHFDGFSGYSFIEKGMEEFRKNQKYKNIDIVRIDRY